MNCIEFESAVEHAVETREPVSEMAIAHMKTCSNCQQMGALCQQLDQVIAVWRQLIPPVGMVDSVMSKLADATYAAEPADLSDLQVELKPQPVRTPHDPTPIRRSTRTQLLAMGSMVACLAVVSVGVFYSAPNATPLAQSERPPIAIEVTIDASYDVSDKLTGVLAGIQSEYHELANETTLAAQDMVTAIPLRVAESVLPTSTELDILPNTNSVKEILKPIGTRVGNAFSFLLEAVPTEIPAG